MTHTLTINISSRIWQLFCLLSVLYTGTLLATVIPAPPQIAARGYVLQDFHSGKILVQALADQRMEPASLTKMMTVYVVSHELKEGNIKNDDLVPISKRAWQAEGSRMFVEVNSQVKLEDLLKGVIIQSGNDASIALAEYVAGSEEAFVSLMNHHAARLGMLGSHFENSTGLPSPNHFSTPLDMAKLAQAVIRDFPLHYNWYSQKDFTYNDIKQYNRNKLLWRDQSVDGIKTGHTESAGFCLVASAEKEGMRLVSVVMGTDSENARAAASQQLLSYGFRFYQTHRLYSIGEQLFTTRVWMGKLKELPLGLNEELYVTIPRGKYDQLETNMLIDDVIRAPIESQEQIGQVQVILESMEVAQRPLVALTEVEEGSLWRRLIDQLILLFYQFLN
ncbi:MAG TPA: serine-type D-Ala-D-Ala carboxypeptidase [Gammaproteobacteria bacterium]|nr:serine-type D-Ala-D-Ala carboxypeptidase [Gammaproteobacteria bacterium]